MIPNNNLSPLPFYKDINKQNHRKENAFGEVYTLIVPYDHILPFQIYRQHRDDDISAVLLRNFDGTVNQDITVKMLAGGLTINQYATAGYDIIVFPDNSALGLTIDEGRYYLELSDGVRTWYSEVFNMVIDFEESLKITYWDDTSIALTDNIIDYSDDFAFQVYLKTDLGYPEYAFEEDVTERSGHTFTEKQVSEKTYKFNFLAPEYLLDAMRIIRMSDNVRITYKDEVYIVDKFLMTPNWLTGGFLASVDVEFQCDTIIKKNGKAVASVVPEVALVEELEEVMLPIFIMNVEDDNIELVSDTPFLIAAHDTGAKTVTLDRAIPSTVNIPLNADRYWVAYYGPGNSCNIAGIDRATNTITYTTLKGSLSVGNRLYFLAPFRTSLMLSWAPLLVPVSPWGATYVTTGGVVHKTDGSYKMIVNGYTKPVSSIGFASSSDLETWEYDLGNPVFNGGTSPFDKSWCNQNWLQSSADPILVEGDPNGYYYWLLTGKNSSGIQAMSIAVIDEDFNVISVQTDPIAVPGYTNNYGQAGGSIKYFNGEYHVAVTHRTQSGADDWIIFHLTIDPVTLTVSTVEQMITSSNKGNWNGRNVDTATLVAYNGILYCLVGGTGLATAGPLYGNRSIGLLRKTPTGWEEAGNNPVIVNPIDGYSLWPSVQGWCVDHTGGFPSVIIEGSTMYVFLAMNSGTDTYRITGVTFDLTKITD